MNECEPSNPCMNSGECNNLNGSYTCTCTADYTDDRCQSFIGMTAVADSACFSLRSNSLDAVLSWFTKSKDNVMQNTIQLIL